MKKRKLILSNNNSAPIKVLGLSSHHKDYRVSWEINKHIKTNLVKISDYIISKPNTEDKAFNIFSYTDRYDVSYMLISNKQNGYVISEKYKNIDFFVVISENENSPELSDISASLKKSNIISGIFVLETGKNIKKLFNSYIL